MLTRRRLLLLCLSIVTCLFLFRERLFLPSHLQDIDFTLSRANIAYFARKSSPVPEIYGLVHLLTSPEGGQLALNETTSNGELGIQLYGQNVNWNKVRSTVDKKWPVIVFSKTYCPYSRKAKALLQDYNLDPPIKVIEVDLRDDQHHVKSTLGRLTGRATFPNVLLKGISIGGSDDVAVLHAKGDLKKRLEEAGITVHGVIRDS